MNNKKQWEVIRIKIWKNKKNCKKSRIKPTINLSKYNESIRFVILQDIGLDHLCVKSIGLIWLLDGSKIDKTKLTIISNYSQKKLYEIVRNNIFELSS